MSVLGVAPGSGEVGIAVSTREDLRSYSVIAPRRKRRRAERTLFTCERIRQLATREAVHVIALVESQATSDEAKEIGRAIEHCAQELGIPVERLDAQLVREKIAGTRPARNRDLVDELVLRHPRLVRLRRRPTTRPGVVSRFFPSDAETYWKWAFLALGGAVVTLNGHLHAKLMAETTQPDAPEIQENEGRAAA